MLFLHVHSYIHAWTPLFRGKRGSRHLVPTSLTRLGWFRIPSIDQYSSLLPPVGVWSVSQYQCGGPSSQNPYASKPRWAVTPPTIIMRRMPIPVRPQPFLEGGCPPSIYAGLARVSPGCPPGRGRLHTCYSPVRRSPAEEDCSSSPLPLDLQVLSLPLAFILSQDQTLRCYLYIFRYLSNFSLSARRPLLYQGTRR